MGSIKEAPTFAFITSRLGSKLSTRDENVSFEFVVIFLLRVNFVVQ